MIHKLPKFFLFLICFLMVFSLKAQNPFSSLRGGTGTDQFLGVAKDGSGNIVVAGNSNSTGLHTIGSERTGSFGIIEGLIAQYSSSGSLNWSRYLNGNFVDNIYDVAVDGSNNIFVCGSTNSTNISTTGVHQTSYGGGATDAFLAKFNSSGTLQFCTYFGGSGTDGAQKIYIDGNNDVFISGSSSSSSAIATSGTYQTSNAGGTSDAFIAKFSNEGVLSWATYYGGSGIEQGVGIKTDNSGSVVLVGFTRSSSSIATGGAQQTSIGGGNDGFIAKFNSTGTSLTWATYIGGTSDESCRTLDIDASGNIFIVGATSSSASISSSGVFQTSFGGGSHDALVAKYNSSGVQQWASYLGGSSNEVGSDIKVDPSGNIIVTGYTGTSSGFSSSNVYQSTHGGDTADAFVAKFNSNFTSKYFATYLGGSASESFASAYVDNNGFIYACGSTNSSSGVATTGAHQTTNGGGYDGLVSLFSNSGDLLTLNWNGSSSGAWASTANWDKSSIPTYGNYVIIESGKPNAPTISTGTQNAGSLVIGSGAQLTVSSGTLNVYGQMSGSGNIAASGGEIVLGGTQPQNIPASYFSSNSINDLSINNTAGVGLLGTLNVSGTLTVSAGTFSTNGFLGISSSAGSTGRVGNSAGTINGNVTVSRYIPAGTRRFRLLSSPISNGTLNSLLDDIFITGNSGSGGFDVSSTNVASAYRYNETLITGTADNGWDPLSSLSDAFTPGRGYRLLIRGDRSDNGRLTGTVTTQNAVTLDVSGTLNQGDVTPSYMTYTSSGTAAHDGWNLMGNPYASNIDWNAIYDNADFGNVNPTMYQRDAVGGSYVSYNASSNSGTGSQYINSFAGFFVQFTGTPSATFKESRKVSNASGSYFKSSQNELLLTFSYGPANFDKTLVKFTDDAKESFLLQEDSKKLFNETLNIYTSSADNEALSLNMLPFQKLEQNYIVPVFVGSTPGNYQLSFSGVENFATCNVYLHDKENGNIKQINSTDTFSFTIADNKLNDHRFNLVFSKFMPSSIVQNEMEINKYDIYPNPVGNELYITYKGLNGAVQSYVIYNEIGQEILAGQLSFGSNRTQNIGVEILAKGVYFIRLMEDNKSKVIKFVK